MYAVRQETDAPRLISYDTRLRGHAPGAYSHHDEPAGGGETDARPFYVSDRVDEIRLRYGGWFLVLLAVLLTLATVLFAAMASYCFFYQHGAFTGHWYWVNWGIEVAVECRT